MPHFVCKLIPPRPTFPFDQSPEESALMRRHAAYWRDLVDRGEVVVYGPVGEPGSPWGLAVFEAESEDAARAVAANDPVVTAGLMTAEVYPMLSAIVRPTAPSERPPGD
jgi:uncharacterized protein YciI